MTKKRAVTKIMGNIIFFMPPTSANCKLPLIFCIVSRHSTNYPIELQFCSCCWRVISTRVVSLKRYFSHGFSCSCHCRPFCCLSNVRNEWNKCFCSMSLGRECNSTNCKNNTVTFYFNITEAWSGLKHSKLWAISTVSKGSHIYIGFFDVFTFFGLDFEGSSKGLGNWAF